MTDKNNTSNQSSLTAEAPLKASYTDYEVIPSHGYSLIVKCRKGEQTVILKGLKEENSKRTLLRNALKREFKQCQRLNHTGIVRYQGLVEVDGYGLCIEEEFIEGRTLQAYLKEQHTDDEKIVIVNQIADALRYVHNQGIAHRNLKPSNILITAQGNYVKLIDFSVLSLDDVKATADTTRFMAPELKDETMTADGTADIYSLGTIMKVMGLTLAYSDVIKRCCAFKRSDRYANIDEFLTDLNHEGSSFTMPTIGKGTVMVAVIAVLVIVLGILTYNYGGALLNQMGKIDVSSVFKSDEETAPEDSVKVTSPNEQTNDSTRNTAPMTGKLAFLNTMKPALYHDLDNIFDKNSADKAKLSKAIKSYYHGLIQANDTLDSEQRAELDRVFGDYVKQKKAALK
ncbi:kinase domain protein [Prevotella sp. oral taxon 306 str. F0472]|uniref:serine/threonine-protein kinase n=1 Tax=Prevotella sp. oral taxon 306 TaxID=712461 RepID=UPI00025BBB5D|nr:serine/threonine-protein kinase [Prevotella sp. oral taxon 306]EID32868.1 kinase domain protein [Prevotella sp. oral taxon 306 str. F0472]